MNQISWRHHYIPMFYLKGFTSKSGKFKISAAGATHKK